jgi:hypothetical protein
MLPRVTLIVEVPTPAPVARPGVLPPLMIVATEVLEEAHVTLAVRVFVLLSLYVPVAANCCVPPVTIVGFTGVTLIDISAGVVTVNMVEPEMAPEAAVIVVGP